MSSFETLQNEIQQALAQNAKALSAQETKIGSIIAGLPKGKIQNAPFFEHAARIHEIQDQIDDKKTTIARWSGIEQELKEIRTQAKELEAKAATLADELEVYYESIGSAAFDMYRDNPSTFKSMEDLLTELQGMETSRRERERKLQKLESGAKPDSLLAKTVNKGRGLMLRGSLRTAQAQRNRQLRAIGEHICEKDALPTFPPSSPLGKTLFPLKELLKDRRDIRREASAIKNKKTEMEEERVVIERRERMRNPIRNMEHEINRMELEVGELHGALGKEFLKSRSKSDYSDDKISAAMAEAKKLVAEERRLKKLQSRAHVALEIEALEAEKAKIAHEVSELQNQIKRLTEDEAAIQDTIEKKVKARGSVSTLKLAPPAKTPQNKKPAAT